jgi:predicted nucleic acid-binding protein
MALICDTGGIYALYDADDAHHELVRRSVETEPGPLFLPVILLAEIDYLLQSRLGVGASLDFLKSIESGAFTLIAPTADDLTRCRELIHQYRDLSIGIADASVVAAAERLGIPRILTVDQRHFRAIRPRNFPFLILLPADAG